ncbi:MAG: Ig-like domain-containing protein, partial [Cellvibrio sp.]
MFAFRHFFYLGLLVILLAGCKASPPDEGSTDPGSYRVVLSLSSPNQVDADSFPNADEVTIKARVLDSSNKPVKSELVKLTTTLGTLISDSVLTDADGYATSKISPSTTLGAGSVTATYGTVSTKLNFELLALPTTPVAATKISLSLQRSGLTINRFKSNEVVQLRALITDANGAPVIAQIVTFSTELGNLDVETGLTDVNGIAQVNLSATNATLGAAEALATAKVNNVDLTASVNYEIIDSSSSITDQVIKLGHFDNSNT